VHLTDSVATDQEQSLFLVPQLPTAWLPPKMLPSGNPSHDPKG